MATASTFVYAGTRIGAVSRGARSAAVAISAGVFAAASPYAASSNINTDARGNLKAWLPPQRVPLVDDNGLMAVAWYRFFSYVAEVRLGGPSAPSITDLSSNVIAVKQDAVAANVATAALSAQASANAEALEVTRQVSVNANLAGAAQIPPVVRIPKLTPDYFDL